MYNTILLCLDFSPNGHLTTSKAREIANDFEANLYLIHVVEPVQTYGYTGSVDLQALKEEGAENMLSTFANKLDISKEQAFIATGLAEKEILDVAKEICADLIILGNHARHGLSQLLGSTAKAVSHGATCDVLNISTGEPT